MLEDQVATPLPDTPEARHQRWRERRSKELAAPDSWLGLIGLFWLEPGSNRVGSALDSAVLLPEGPLYLGELFWEENSVRWRPVPDCPAQVEGGEAGADATVLHTDAAGEPSCVRYGDFVFFVIEREGRLAVRLRDLAWSGRRAFAGVDCYPFDLAWRIEAVLEPLPQPFSLEVPNVMGELKAVTVDWRAVFRSGGEMHALLPLEVKDGSIFAVFRDATSGRETYGGGRFLRAARSAAGRVTLDFNRAINPPCAFTPFATCPLPPPENWLTIPVRAGERRFAADY